MTDVNRFRAIEAAMQLKDLKSGDIVTEVHMAAINLFIGNLLAAARNIPMREIRINFEGGKPNIEKGADLVKQIEVGNIIYPTARPLGREE